MRCCWQTMLMIFFVEVNKRIGGVGQAQRMRSAISPNGSPSQQLEWRYRARSAELNVRLRGAAPGMASDGTLPDGSRRNCDHRIFEFDTRHAVAKRRMKRCGSRSAPIWRCCGLGRATIMETEGQ